MTDPSADEARDLLRSYQVRGTPLYVVGSFDAGVTVLSQQTRALNFTWAALESGLIRSHVAAGGDTVRGADDAPVEVAVIGGGFAGLTVAAGLLKKGANVRVTIFEQRDTLLPLQEGSDTRWLHPRIYDWPGQGSDASVAMLPVMNWAAGRASDVVVQVLGEWNAVLREERRSAQAAAHVAAHADGAGGPAMLRLYCNTRHLQVDGRPGNGRLSIEWVGEERDPTDGRALPDRAPSAVGATAGFDLAILTIGFGLERDGTLSYWRNDTLGQPSLDEPRSTFLVSGQGDGAMIDLLRLRISQFRQDRILSELFSRRPALLNAFRHLQHDYAPESLTPGLFDALEKLGADGADTRDEFEAARGDLLRRLRRDTDVILQLKVKKIAELFDPATARISFQNKLLVYFLYKCGAFVPSTADEVDLTRQHSIPSARVVRRHGTLRDEQFRSVLSDRLYEAVCAQRGAARPDPFTQTDRQRWPGGYFGFPGRSADAHRLADTYREHWRTEYLPAATELMAATLCSAVAGAILADHPAPGRLRVTLHRAMPFGTEELLQQTCDYVGRDAAGKVSAAGRTFPARNATIGLAYRCREIVRTVKGTGPSELQAAMESLQLNTASRRMSSKVGFVAAIPLLEPEIPGRFYEPSPVFGVLYIDSQAPGFFLDDPELDRIVRMVQRWLDTLERLERPDQLAEHPVSRIRNVPMARPGQVVPERESVLSGAEAALQTVESVRPPATADAFQFNFDYAEFSLVQAGAQPGGYHADA